MKFKDLKIIEPILKAIEDKGYQNPTPIQEQAIAPILCGNDLLACAQTGTGKTAAFAIPILQQLYSKNNTSDKKIRALILTPTRELAIQIRDNFREYGENTNLKCSVIFGGVNQKSQVEVLKKGVDILVATPGRLLDLINQKHAKLDDVNYLVLDEADRMLDMGFIHDVKRVISHIKKDHQTLLFSATMPKEIEELSKLFLNNPKKIVVTPVSSTVEKINQSLYYVDKNNKVPLLIDLLKDSSLESVLIFTKTKHGANRLVKSLDSNNIKSAAIHGNKSQGARELALKSFKNGEIKILVATDIAARGIDVNNLSHVINYELPNVPETYVHRIGRTGRAGKAGIAISFSDFSEKPFVKSIEKLTNQKINVVYNHDYPMVINCIIPDKKQQKRFVSNKSTVKTEKPYKSKYNKRKTTFESN